MPLDIVYLIRFSAFAEVCEMQEMKKYDDEELSRERARWYVCVCVCFCLELRHTNPNEQNKNRTCT